MVIREAKNDEFSVIGPCFVHGLEDANVILGKLPSPWTVQVLYDGCGLLSTHQFLNRDTGVLSEDDPRLEPSSEWERCTYERTGDDPFFVQCFRNKITGKVIKHDPRLEPGALEDRGVKLDIFNLI